MSSRNMSYRKPVPQYIPTPPPSPPRPSPLRLSLALPCHDAPPLSGDYLETITNHPSPSSVSSFLAPAAATPSPFVYHYPTSPSPPLRPIHPRKRRLHQHYRPPTPPLPARRAKRRRHPSIERLSNASLFYQHQESSQAVDITIQGIESSVDMSATSLLRNSPSFHTEKTLVSVNYSEPSAGWSNDVASAITSDPDNHSTQVSAMHTLSVDKVKHLTAVATPLHNLSFWERLEIWGRSFKSKLTGLTFIFCR